MVFNKQMVDTRPDLCGYGWQNRVRRKTRDGVMFRVALGGLGMAAFVPLLLFIAIRGSNLSLFHNQLESIALTKFYDPQGITGVARPHAFSLSLRKLPQGGVGIVMGDQASFKIPQDTAAFKKYIESRARQLEHLSMLTMDETPGASRITVWPERGLGFVELQNILSILTEAGFDDFDLAVEPFDSKPEKSNGAI